MSDQPNLQPEPEPNWLDRLTGSITDIEAFEEALRLGRIYRQSECLPDDEPTPEGEGP